jgi:geranylgeranyl pyrophosphate synthase
MKFEPLHLPRLVPLQKLRPPQSNIPATPAERSRLAQLARHYVAEFAPVPPMPQAELVRHATRVVEMATCDPAYRDYVAVLINNEMWRETLASIPFNKRLLLLPKCLRVESKCPAPFDEFGLLCKQCGLCSIQDLQQEAERLGYAVLVAEGSAVVMSMIQTGRIEAVVGVSCLGVLERAFPYMEAAAVPGVAIPLLQNDCADTNVDLDWVWDYIHLTTEDETRRLDLGALRQEVETWFAPFALDQVMGPAEGAAEQLGRDWLARAGKRWRPFLAVAVFEALRADRHQPFPSELRRIAVAVECFHKASLIHDDIEDNDASRYGEPSLHAEHGVPVALNVGDLLIGEGYRLIAESDFSPAQRAAMLAVAAQGQRELCRGQGAELHWTRAPQPLSTARVLDIFRHKTAPAFEVALRLGALCAGVAKHDEVGEVLSRYSEALGIAYQIRDDLSDWDGEEESNDLAGLRPSVVLAVAHERATGERRQRLGDFWRRAASPQPSLATVAAWCRELKADERALALQATYREAAVQALAGLTNANLKGLLRRVLGRIFNDLQIHGWCKEVEALTRPK